MTMFNFLNPYLFWIKLAGFAIALATAAGVSGYVVHNIDVVKLQAVQLVDSKAQTASVTASLTQLQGFINKMDAAGGDYTAALDQIKADFAALKLEFKNATLKPLPADCRPDAGRLRVLTDAVAAANKGASAAK